MKKQFDAVIADAQTDKEAAISSGMSDAAADDILSAARKCRRPRTDVSAIARAVVHAHPRQLAVLPLAKNSVFLTASAVRGC